MPDQEVPAITVAPGFKTTTVRLTQQMFDEMDLFAQALNQNTTDFIKDAVEGHISRLAKSPKVQKSLQRQIQRQQHRLEAIMNRVGARADDGQEG
jgi:hypothetical protein